MATKPTRLQEQACDKLAEALVLIADASRLDGKSALSAGDFAEIARRLAAASSAFDLETIVGRALHRRVRNLGLRPGAADLVVLMEDAGTPLERLLLDDESFKGRIEELEAELGEI